MTNILSWMRTGLVTLLGVAVLGTPTIAAARDRCGNQGASYRGDRQSYYGADRGYGYRADRAAYSGYRNAPYRNGGYANNSYGNNSNYGYRENAYYGDPYYTPTRSAGKSAAIIGGGAAAGAVIGGLAGGGKGAAIGAAVGGIGGLIYDRKTRNGTTGW